MPKVTDYELEHYEEELERPHKVKKKTKNNKRKEVLR
jgi:hypothetical protein